MPELVSNSKAKNTQRKYKSGFERWRKWAEKFPEVATLPARDIYVCLFLVSLIQQGVSCSIINEVYYGIKWIHEITGYENPCTSSLIMSVLEAGCRLLSKPARKKEVVTPETIQSLFLMFGHSTATLADLRILVISVLCYAGFLRFDELIKLRRCDFSIEEAFMRIFIERSKTDIYRDGAWVVIARTGLHTCPVSLTLRYFTLGGISPDSDEYIFRALSYCSSTGKYKLRGTTPLSYSRTREIVLEAFEKIGLPKKDYGLHSFRAGGASAAANSNISDRLFKRHGRWRSEKAKDGYVKDNVEGLLSVSRALGI